MTIKERNNLVKKWLWRYRVCLIDLRRMHAEYLQVLSVQCSPKAISYDGMPGSGEPTDLSDMIVSRKYLEDRMRTRRQDADQTCSELLKAIGMLDNNVQREIVSLRYSQLKDDCGFYSMDEIADHLHYSVSLVKAEHGAALIALVPIINTLCPEDPIPTN